MFDKSLINQDNPVICWWSGGITSAIACKLAIDLFGIENCRIIMIDTANEDDDTYRFKKDCEKLLYKKKIEVISRIGKDYESIHDVWLRFNSLNVAHGAICSSELKKITREKWQKENNYSYQVFGFEFDKKEFNRAKSMKLNHPQCKPIFPLLIFNYDKQDCLNIMKSHNIPVPRAYDWGFKNNNCLKTGCVQGGIGYWQKIAIDKPELFDKMANFEHELTNRKGKPVTMNKDQSKDAKESGNTLVFLKKHPSYPELKSVTEIKGRGVKPLSECNGFCGTNDLNPLNETYKEINFQD